VFEGEKTRVFWWGLIFVGLSVCVLFSIFWYFFVLTSYFAWRLVVPEIFGSIVFLLIGLYMMKSGTRKANQAKSN
jgi:small neutral amino acid transporter SnatA (MarC family)